MRKLSKDEVLTRLEIYQEIIEHFEMDIVDTPAEQKQVDIVREEIKKLSDRFGKKHCMKFAEKENE
ncbi:MAG: hypothetical protein J7L15_08180 [Clostridiales bacterium]|nr:hypothetical protein [Clostridiales bacterium]